MFYALNNLLQLHDAEDMSFTKWTPTTWRRAFECARAVLKKAAEFDGAK